MKRKKKGNIYKQDRYREFKDKRHDTYQSGKKYREPTRCPDCGSLFINGRWTWEETGREAEAVLCPACKRIEDNYPAGYAELSGPFFREHEFEIRHLIRNLERTESKEHPLERIMEIRDEDDHLVVTTTGMHLARRIGDSLKQAYEGELHITYEAESFVRVTWQR